MLFITALLPTLAFATALPASASQLSCGTDYHGSGGCANVTRAQQGGYSYHEGQLGYFTFAQCHESCMKSSECASFQYSYYVDSGFGYPECYLYALPVSKYTTSNCTASGTQVLATFYDKECPPLVPDTEGQIPATCVDSYCYPLGTLKEPLFYNDQLAFFNNITNTECKQKCRHHAQCKSIFWQSFDADTYMPFNSTQNEDGPNLPVCVLLSQPVQYLIQADGLQSVPLYDLLCPDTPDGYLTRAPICPNGKSPHSSV